MEAIMVNFGNEWDELLKDEFTKEYYLRLREFLKKEYSTQRIFPGMYDIFNALKYTSYNDVKCVIIGQDPYHGEGQAHGLSFSVRKGIAPPPSLINIFKEIRDDVGIDNLGKHGELTKWAGNGVLLLNSVLTVRANQPRSHRNQGWEQFTTDVIQLLNLREKPMVFMLWGSDAKAKQQFITNPAHLVLKSAHPSHFSKANGFLSSHGLEPIDWSID